MYDIILNKEVYTMKKKYIKILIIALFTISIIILFVLLTHLNNKKIIVEDSYIGLVDSHMRELSFVTMGVYIDSR